MRLYLLRHGEVTSYRGDVPITAAGKEEAFAVGQSFARRERGPVAVLSGDTRRTIDTAAHLALGVTDAGGRVVGPTVAFALRNPDLYLGGVRIEMAGSAEALADQVDGLSAQDVAALDFFPEFVASPDRVGWWLAHESPPGDDAESVARRVRSFAVSLADPISARSDVVVAVTHSPLIRAVGLDFLGRDIGEPAWLSGIVLSLGSDGELSGEEFAEEAA